MAGASWSVVPVNYPGTRPITTADACGLPTGSYFTGTTAGLTWAEYSSLAGGLGRLRRACCGGGFRPTPASPAQGWWVDDIAITNVMVPERCDSEPPLFADGFETGRHNGVGSDRAIAGIGPVRPPSGEETAFISSILALLVRLSCCGIVQTSFSSRLSKTDALWSGTSIVKSTWSPSGWTLTAYS